MTPTPSEIKGEVSNALEALDDAEATIQQDRMNNAINRAYYACFHAALWSKDYAPRTHKGVAVLQRERKKRSSAS